MNTISTKNLVLRLISLCAPIFMLIGLGISGEFAFDFYYNYYYGFDIYFGYYLFNVILSTILDTLALLVCIALLVINIVPFATGKTVPRVGGISVIAVAVIMLIRFLINMIVLSIRYSTFYFRLYNFEAVLLTAIPVIVYFVCNARLVDNTKGETVLENADTENADNANTSNGVYELGSNAETGNAKMNDRQIDACIMAVKDYVPTDRLLFLRDKLEKANEKSYKRISALSLKKPTTVLLLSIFLGGFGIDRFYIGDTGIGVLKLLFGWLTGYIWNIVDIFLCYKKTQEKNLEEVMSCIVK